MVMDTISEAMVISSANGSTNCSIYDLSTGNLLRAYKEGHTVPKGLSLIREDYVLSALNKEKAMNIWTISRNNESGKMPMTGPVTCIAVTDYGDYCVAAIDKSIHLWQLSTGCKMEVLLCHSQPITCLKFSSDGTYIISGGKDGLVLVWLLPVALDAYSSSDDKKPHFVWMDHSSEITDIIVGKLGFFARVMTASKDMTCKIYELDTGNILNTVCTDCEINAMALDNTEYFLTLGCSDGNIYKINLFTTRDGDVLHPSLESKFVGHKKAVTCLSISTFGKYLLSGSEDCSCRVWNMSNFICIRTLAFEGPITNVIITLTPPGLKVEGNYIPRFIAKGLQKMLDKKNYNNKLPKMRIPDRSLSLMHVEIPGTECEKMLLQESEDALNRRSKKVSVQKLETINTQLYSYALNDIMSMRSTLQVDSD